MRVVATLALFGWCSWMVACSSSSKGEADASTEAAPDVGCVPVDSGPLDDALVAEGQTLVQTEKCRKCHGDTLSGNFDGIMAPDNIGQVYPPNLTNDPASGLGCWTNAQIVNAILNGYDNTNTPICLPMPRFADAGLDGATALAVAEYLRSLPVLVDNVPNSPMCAPGGGPLDAGPPDAPEEDTGTHHDSGVHDSGTHDSGFHDAGTHDSSVPEDTGAHDAGEPGDSSENADSSVHDAGNDALVDAASD